MTEATNDMNASISFGGAATPIPVRHRGGARKLRKQLERDILQLYRINKLAAEVNERLTDICAETRAGIRDGGEVLAETNGKGGRHAPTN